MERKIDEGNMEIVRLQRMVMKTGSKQTSEFPEPNTIETKADLLHLFERLETEATYKAHIVSKI
jgi:hypothetical protein